VILLKTSAIMEGLQSLHLELEGRKSRMTTDPRSQARTERGEFRFTVKEFADGTPFITAEPQRITTTVVGDDAFFSFDDSH
jgi:hypothetical protein